MRIARRAARFKQRESTGNPTSHSPHPERAHIAKRVLNGDTTAGREVNFEELSPAVQPDLPNNGYSIPLLVESQGTLPYAPYVWPVWKVRAEQLPLWLSEARLPSTFGQVTLRVLGTCV